MCHRILIGVNNYFFRTELEKHVAEAGCSIRSTGNGLELLGWLTNESSEKPAADMIIVSHYLDPLNSDEILDFIVSNKLTLPVMVLNPSLDKAGFPSSAEVSTPAPEFCCNERFFSLVKSKVEAVTKNGVMACFFAKSA